MDNVRWICAAARKKTLRAGAICEAENNRRFHLALIRVMLATMRGKFKPQILVIGGGLGGLAAAARLARAGCQVTLTERNERVGGKMNTLSWQDFHWDTGPSLLTMPHVLEALWESLGAKLEEDLTLLRLPESCLYHWQDGSTLREDSAFWRSPDVAAFLKYSQGLYDISANTFLHNPPTEWKKQLRLSNLPLLRHFPKLADPRTMARTTKRFFPSSPQLQQLFNRFATYNGSSPYATPSAFNIIPYVQARFGGWYVKGGMYQIAAALEKRARKLGVVIETGVEVTRLQENSGHWTVFQRPTSGGPASPRTFTGIVCNQDRLEATKRFLDPIFKPTRTLSSSGFVIRAAIGRSYPELSHHNIFFPQDSENEFREIFHENAVPTQPTIYVAISAKSDPARARPGCENWFVLINTPPTDANTHWPSLAPRLADRIFSSLTRFGLDDPRPHILWQSYFTPADFASDYLATGGALYGYASHSPTTAFRRPAMTCDKHGLVFTGGSTHPGVACPWCCCRGKWRPTHCWHNSGAHHCRCQMRHAPTAIKGMLRRPLSARNEQRITVQASQGR